MAFDHITETVAHFIGAFQMDTEAARLREAYDSFRGHPAAPDTTFDPVQVRIHITSPYDLEDFDPKLRLALPVAAPSQPEPWAWQIAPPAHIQVASPEMRHSDQFDVPAAPARGADVHWTIPLPPELLTVTIQVLYLSDNDLLSFRGGTEFIAPEDLTARLHGYAQQATVLGGDLSVLISQMLPDAGPPGASEALSFAQAITALPADQGEGGLIRLAPGVASDTDATDRLYVNGQHAEAMPEHRDYLPAPLAARIDPPETSEADTEAPHAGSASAYSVPAGHHLSTGGNLTVNEAYIAVNGVDADVILVGGDLVQIDVINQVNLVYLTDATGGADALVAGHLVARSPVDAVLSGGAQVGVAQAQDDLSGVTGSDTTAATEAADSGAGAFHVPGMARAFNAAQIDPALILPPGPDATDDPAASPAQEGPLQLPAYWQVERIDGDVVFENRIDQHIFASDHDRIEAVFTASASQISTGDNTLSNFTTIEALSMHYDLIIVGGSYITLNVIEQMNVLFDVDQIIGLPDGGALGWGDDLLLNSAEILHGSRDTLQALQDNFAKLLDTMATGAGTLSAAVAHDPLFAGHGTLSALYISGDLIETNIVRQFSYLGDADQIALAEGAAMASAVLAGMQIDTGENAMLNAASINDLGIDSTVMAAGQVYSDALIHQAGLIDDQMPGLDGLAGPGSALASEAVAFLAPEMMEHGPPDDPQGGAVLADLAAQTAPQDGLHLLTA